MVLTEKHIIDINHHLYDEIDNLCFLSKNLYNRANYIIRQKFINTSKEKKAGLVENATYLNYYNINRILIDDKDYDFYMLPAKISNQVLMLLDKNWSGFFKSIKDWKINPSKYTGRPSLPRYKNKTKGRNVLIYELGAISKPSLRKNIIKLSKTNVEIPFIAKQKDNSLETKQVRIVPLKNNRYKIEIIYEKNEINLNLNKENIISIDLGVNNLMTLTSNKRDLNPLIINGRTLKSINQYYNMKLAEYKSDLPIIDEKQLPSSKRIKKLTFKRNQKIDDYLHKSSRFIINYCINNDIGTIVIGKNKQWKDESNMGKINNQNFVSIPHNILIDYIKYKAELVGIEVVITEESYTSKASFLDLDFIPVYKKDNEEKYLFSGRRIKRGKYKSKLKGLINADVNGSYNILRKAFPNVFTDGIEGFAVNPIRITSNKFKTFFNVF